MYKHTAHRTTTIFKLHMRNDVILSNGHLLVFNFCCFVISNISHELLTQHNAQGSVSPVSAVAKNPWGKHLPGI